MFNFALIISNSVCFWNIPEHEQIAGMIPNLNQGLPPFYHLSLPLLLGLIIKVLQTDLDTIFDYVFKKEENFFLEKACKYIMLKSINNWTIVALS